MLGNLVFTVRTQPGGNVSLVIISMTWWLAFPGGFNLRACRITLENKRDRRPATGVAASAKLSHETFLVPLSRVIAARARDSKVNLFAGQVSFWAGKTHTLQASTLTAVFIWGRGAKTWGIRRYIYITYCISTIGLSCHCKCEVPEDHDHWDYLKVPEVGIYLQFTCFNRDIQEISGLLSNNF